AGQGSDRSIQGSSWGAYLLVGSGGTLLVAGGVFAALALSARADAQAACVTIERGLICRQAASDALDRDASFSLLADIGLWSGLALASAGLAFLLFGGDRPEEPGSAAPRAVLGASPTPGGALLLAQGSF
ncbi:MAG: hypothetical protein OEY14_12880, partial [Myxococcales bacterium]|nr:hypothetical protein [Myxococcales bacterium]